MPTNTLYPPPYYPITRLTDGRLLSHDPGLPNTPLHTAAAANQGLRLRIYNPDSNTTHTIFNNGQTADFDRYGRLMDRAGVEHARRIHQIRSDIAAENSPYSAPRPRPSAASPAPPLMPPLRAAPAPTQARVRKDKTGFTIVIAPSGKAKYFDPHGNPATSQAWGKASRALAGPAQADPNLYWETAKAGGVEFGHQVSKFWNGATDLAGQSIGNAGEYVGNRLHEGHGLWTGDWNEVLAAREGQQKNVDALNRLADQMTPGTFKDVADASGSASGGDWKSARSTIAAIPQKNIQAFKDDPQQWALNFAATVAPLGENLLAKSASMTRYAAGLRALGQTERAGVVEARAVALKSIGNGMTLKPVTEAVEGALTKHGSKLPVVGKKIAQIAETNAQMNRLAQRQAATADLNRDLRRVKTTHIPPNTVRMAFPQDLHSAKPVQVDVRGAPVRLSPAPVKPTLTHGDLDTTFDGSKYESRLRQAENSLTGAGVKNEDARRLITTGILNQEFMRRLNGIGAGWYDIQSTIPGHGAYNDPNSGFGVTPNYTLAAQGYPEALGHIADALGLLTDQQEMLTTRPPRIREQLTPEELPTINVNFNLPRNTPVQVYKDVAHELATNKHLVDRKGHALFSGSTLYTTPMGDQTFYANSYYSQTLGGLSAEEYVADVAAKRGIIDGVLAKYGLTSGFDVEGAIARPYNRPENHPTDFLERTLQEGQRGFSNGGANHTGVSGRSGRGQQTFGAGGNAPEGTVDLRTRILQHSAEHIYHGLTEAINNPVGFAQKNGYVLYSPSAGEATLTDFPGLPPEWGAASGVPENGGPLLVPPHIMTGVTAATRAANLTPPSHPPDPWAMASLAKRLGVANPLQNEVNAYAAAKSPQQRRAAAAILRQRAATLQPLYNRMMQTQQ